MVGTFGTRNASSAGQTAQIKRVQLHVGVGQKKPHINDRANSRALTEISKKRKWTKAKE